MKKLHIATTCHNRTNDLCKLLNVLNKSAKDLNIDVYLHITFTGTEISVLKNYDKLHIHTHILKDAWFTEAINNSLASLSYYVDRNSICGIMNDDVIINKNFIKKILELPYQSNSIFVPACMDISTSKITDGVIYADFENWKFTDKYTPEALPCFTTRTVFFSGDVFLDIMKRGIRLNKQLPMYCSDLEYGIRLGKIYRLCNVGKKNKQSIIRTASNTKKYPIWSKKNPSNPYYFTKFIILASPKKYWLKNIVKVWLYAIMIEIRRIIK